MDRKNSQKAYIPEAGHIINAGTRTVDGLQAYRKSVECEGGASERAECHSFHTSTCAIYSVDKCSDSYGEKKNVSDRKICRASRETQGESGVVVERLRESDIRFRSLVVRLRGVEFSRRLAVRLLGGEKRLERLLLQGKIHATKRQGASNTMWRFDAAEVVMYVKPNKLFLI